MDAVDVEFFSPVFCWFFFSLPSPFCISSTLDCDPLWHFSTTLLLLFLKLIMEKYIMHLKQVK